MLGLRGLGFGVAVRGFSTLHVRALLHRRCQFVPRHAVVGMALVVWAPCAAGGRSEASAPL
eukprot:1609991-Alexandrium_andersonii.AAC.1